ncbi:MAG TPA: hypothetical protein VEX38_05300 [Fimbriimonadaceae bacterium]|nr:hypothetical protein [Fimbriimonadaceae bacterium]
MSDEALPLERELANAVGMKLLDVPWVQELFPQGFLISDREDLYDSADRVPVYMEPVDVGVTDDLLERKFEFRFPAIPEVEPLRDRLNAAFLPTMPHEEGTYVFVTAPATIVDPYSKALIEVSLIVSVTKRGHAI